MLRERVIHDTDQGTHFVSERHGDGNVRVSVDEIGGAVDGIDDECGRGGEAARGGCFFTEEGVGGVGFFQGRGYHGFDCLVGFGDEVGGVLLGVDGGERGVGGGYHRAGVESEGVEGVVDFLEI